MSSTQNGSIPGLRVTLVLCVALAWGLTVRAKVPMRAKNDSFDPYEWHLVPANNEAVTYLSDLKSGVFSIQLSGERSRCGLASRGPGMTLVV